MQSSYGAGQAQPGLLVACSDGISGQILPIMQTESRSRPLNERHRKIMKTFAERLKAAREAKYDSAEQFAHLLLMTPHAYRKYERGESEPNYETLTRICTLLSITPNDLLPDAAGDRPKRPPQAGKRPKAA